MAVVGHRHNRLSIPYHPQTAAPTPPQTMPVQTNLHHHSHHNQILAAAVSSPFYQPVLPQQDIQPDRAIGYGAFGVVWLDYVTCLYYI